MANAQDKTDSETNGRATCAQCDKAIDVGIVRTISDSLNVPLALMGGACFIKAGVPFLSHMMVRKAWLGLLMVGFTYVAMLCSEDGTKNVCQCNSEAIDEFACSSCHGDVFADDDFCPSCGEPLED